jgi:hypothetical protein
MSFALLKQHRFEKCMMMFKRKFHKTLRVQSNLLNVEENDGLRKITMIDTKTRLLIS